MVTLARGPCRVRVMLSGGIASPHFMCSAVAKGASCRTSSGCSSTKGGRRVLGGDGEGAV
eukprot:scaffold60150_cov60-Phaeocystis_antarctica.AAC.1